MKNLSRILSIVGFSILSGGFGLGVTWLIVAFLVKFHVLKNNDYLLSIIMPILIIGGIVGLIVGIVVSIRVAKADPETEKAIENKYVGEGGCFYIYFGAPTFTMVALTFLFGGKFEKLENKLGTATSTYLTLGIFLAILTISLILREHVPKNFIIPIGIIGWLLNLW